MITSVFFFSIMGNVNDKRRSDEGALTSYLMLN